MEGSVPPQSVTAEISNALTRITHQFTGRGPTRARTIISREIVLVIMYDTLTKAERTLADHGEGQRVLESRLVMQRTMREAYAGAIDSILGRRVVAFMSANHLDPDTAAEIFVLDSDSDATHEGTGESSHKGRIS